uniref:PHD-type domain-containing protein n=1 Tax=Hyaloperonospora arabidopsidis (strain Emoy2) TaxID=559515 RepID=M4BP30_HYAAE
MVDEMNLQQQRAKRVLYPPRLMVDFKSLGVEALKRYGKFYHLKLNEDWTKEELAAQVARHFDLSLEVEEDDSIVAFMQRLRNGERTAVKRSSVRDKERKALIAAEKAKHKSTSRKRQRDHSVSMPSGRSANNRSSHTASTTTAGNSSNHGHGSSHSSGTASSSHSSRGQGSEGRKAPPNSSKLSTASGGKTKKTKKDADAGEDNELYCICNLPSYGNMIACDGKTCPNPSQWYHLECVGLADGRHPDTWLCPECDPKGFASGSSSCHKKKKNKRSKSPGNK